MNERPGAASVKQAARPGCFQYLSYEGTSPAFQLREPVLLLSPSGEEVQAAAVAAAAAAALPEVPKVMQSDGKKPLPALNTSNNMTLLETATRLRNNNTTHTACIAILFICVECG